ncbi:hypothetical protein ACVITL_006494 [Rhizobium pisi]
MALFQDFRKRVEIDHRAAGIVDEDGAFLKELRAKTSRDRSGLGGDGAQFFQVEVTFKLTQGLIVDLP